MEVPKPLSVDARPVPVSVGPDAVPADAAMGDGDGGSPTQHSMNAQPAPAAAEARPAPASADEAEARPALEDAAVEVCGGGGDRRRVPSGVAACPSRAPSVAKCCDNTSASVGPVYPPSLQSFIDALAASVGHASRRVGNDVGSLLDETMLRAACARLHSARD
jgi:hypothetical protein